MSAPPPLPILAIDAGNTHLRLAALMGGTIAAHTRHVRLDEDAPPPGELVAWVRTLGPFRGTVALLAREAMLPGIEALAAAAGAPPPMRIHHHGPLPFAIRYEDDSRAGPDRIANAAGLRVRVGWPAASIDFGTATTIEVVDQAGDLAGGAIMPGIGIGLRALHEATAGRLPLLEPEAPLRALGRSTGDAMRAGAVLAHVRGAEALVRESLEEIGAAGAPVVVTGGLAPLVAPLLRIPARLMPDLTLAGAAALWEAAGR